MTYFIVYLLIGIASMGWFVRDCGGDIKRSEFIVILFVGFFWPIVGLWMAWEFGEEAASRVRMSDRYSRWLEWWDQPICKRRTSRT